MAKFKPAAGSGGKKREAPAPTRGLIPCGILIALGLGLLFVLMYYSLQSSGK